MVQRVQSGGQIESRKFRPVMRPLSSSPPEAWHKYICRCQVMCSSQRPGATGWRSRTLGPGDQSLPRALHGQGSGDCRTGYFEVGSRHVRLFCILFILSIGYCPIYVTQIPDSRVDRTRLADTCTDRCPDQSVCSRFLLSVGNHCNIPPTDTIPVLIFCILVLGSCLVFLHSPP